MKDSFGESYARNQSRTTYRYFPWLGSAGLSILVTLITSGNECTFGDARTSVVLSNCRRPVHPLPALMPNIALPGLVAPHPDSMPDCASENRAGTADSVSEATAKSPY